MISRHFNAAGFVAVLIAMAVNVASAQSNVALVVGNDAYQHGKPLSTTVADASLMAETMRAAGYDVTELRDVQQRDHGQIMNNFLNKIAGAGSTHHRVVLRSRLWPGHRTGGATRPRHHAGAGGNGDRVRFRAGRSRRGRSRDLYAHARHVDAPTRARV